MGARSYRRKSKRTMDTSALAFPKPSDIAVEPIHVRVYPGGLEICNKATREGRAEYRRRVRVMWERQGGRCCLEGFILGCPGILRLSEASFEHEWGRGMGGAIRDDRTELPDGARINGAAHVECNSLKGSRRIAYNERFNAIRKAGKCPQD